MLSWGSERTNMEGVTEAAIEKLKNLNNFVNGGVPSYITASEDVWKGLRYYYKAYGSDYSTYTPANFISDFRQYATFDLQRDLLALFGFSLTWTIVRYVLSILVFHPLARYFQLLPQNRLKYPESAWKLMVYTTLWSYTCYVLFGLNQYNHIFYEPTTLWDDYVPGMEIEDVVYYLYMLQLSFYCHSVYASFFMDQWRDDSLVMVFHHFLTISLIGFSLLARYHKIGILVLFLHDITDICLEFTKCNVYFKRRGGKFYRFHDLLSNIGFLIFASAWVLFRLYWFPLKALYSTGYGAVNRHRETNKLPFYFFFNGLLWLLQVLQIYWFLFIGVFLVKVVSGQINEVDDIREAEVKEQYRKPSKSSGNGRKKTN